MLSPVSFDSISKSSKFFKYQNLNIYFVIPICIYETVKIVFNFYFFDGLMWGKRRGAKIKGVPRFKTGDMPYAYPPPDGCRRECAN